MGLEMVDIPEGHSRLLFHISVSSELKIDLGLELWTSKHISANAKRNASIAS